MSSPDDTNPLDTLSAHCHCRTTRRLSFFDRDIFSRSRKAELRPRASRRLERFRLSMLIQSRSPYLGRGEAPVGQPLCRGLLCRAKGAPPKRGQGPLSRLRPPRRKCRGVRQRQHLHDSSRAAIRSEFRRAKKPRPAAAGRARNWQSVHVG